MFCRFALIFIPPERIKCGILLLQLLRLFRLLLFPLSFSFSSSSILHYIKSNFQVHKMEKKHLINFTLFLFSRKIHEKFDFLSLHRDILPPKKVKQNKCTNTIMSKKKREKSCALWES